MLKHERGIQWIRERQCWSTVLDYIVQNQTIYVVRRAIDFLTDFLFLIVHDDELCRQIIELILKPINDSVYDENFEQISVIVDSTDLQQKVMPGVNLVCNILKVYIRKNEPSSLANHIINTCKGSINLCKLTDMTQDRVFFEKIMTCHVYINFARLVDTFMAEQQKTNVSALDRACTSSIDYNEFGLNFLNSIKFCLLKNFPLSVLSQARLYYEQWKALGDRVPNDIVLGTQLANFENQIIVFQIMPIILMIQKDDVTSNEVTNEYITKLFNISTEHTIRMCYANRDAIRRDNNKASEIACKAIQNILSMGSIMQKDSAVIVFQALAHTVKGFAIMARDGNGEELGKDPALLRSVLTGLYKLVTDYKITWKESFETIGVLNFMLYLLQHSSLSASVCIHVFHAPIFDFRCS